jgi:hypothetical protein
VPCTAVQIKFLLSILNEEPIAVAAQSNASVYGRALAGIVGLNPAHGCLSVVSVVCCQVEVSATG